MWQFLDSYWEAIHFLFLSCLDATDQLEQKVIEFFVNAKKNKPEWREEQMEVIKKVNQMFNIPAATAQVVSPPVGSYINFCE